MDEKELIEALIKARGFNTVKSFAENINIPYTTLKTMLEKGIKRSNVELVIKLAAGLDLSTDNLIRITGPNGLRLVKEKDTEMIPLLGCVCAGKPLIAEECLMGFIEVPKSEVKNGDYFFLKVNGDSMTGARIYPGDRVLIRQQPDVEDGQIAVVMVDGKEATLKRIRKADGRVWLIAENPSYPTRLIENEEARILGVVQKVEFDPL